MSKRERREWSMFDSIVFYLPKGQFKLLNRDKFDGRETKTIDGRFEVGTAFVNQFRKQKKKAGIYFPVIKLPSQNSHDSKGNKIKSESVEIQVSLPKAKNATNIFEVDTHDKDNIYEILLGYLKEIGIQSDIKSLGEGILKRVDFSKVFYIPSYLGTATQIIKKLSQIDYKQSSDYKLSYYENNERSICLKFFNKTQGYAIYSKFGEIEANGYTLFENQIRKQIEVGNLQDTAIKFELSLQRRQSMNAVLRRLTSTKKKDFTLDDLFHYEDVAKLALIETFEKVFSTVNVGLVTLGEMQNNVLDALLINRGLNINQRTMLYYWVNMATKIGVKETMAMLKKEYKGGTYDRKSRELKDIIKEVGQIDHNLLNIINFLAEKHKEFKILKP